MSDPVNKWNQPVAPPPPMFFGKKERDLVKQVNDELAERVIGQEVAYYPISIEESNFNETYGEAIDKVSLPPVRVYAYVEVANEQTNERYGYEYQTKLTVNFHRKRLTADQNLFVRVGDFVQYGSEFYEIVKTYNDTRYYFGQVEHKFQISAECVRARKGTFRVLPAIDRKPDRGVVAGESTTPAPRVAPIPPINATYITVTPNARLSRERVLTAGSGITLTDGGANSTLTIAASGQNAVGPTGSVQFTPGGGTFSGSHSLRFFSATPLLELTGAMRINGELTASAFNLTPRSGSLAGGASYLGLDSSNNLVLTSAAATATTPAGSNTQVQFNNSGVFGASANFTFDGSAVNIVGELTASTTISASSFHGDGSALTGITTAPAGSTTEIQYNNAGVFAGSSNLTFTGTQFATGVTSHLSGGLIHKRTAVVTSYTASATDYLLGVTGVPTAILLNATAFTEGQTLVVKDESGAATLSNPVTLNASGVQTIDGASSVTIDSAYGSVLVYTNGSNWFIY